MRTQESSSFFPSSFFQRENWEKNPQGRRQTHDLYLEAVGTFQRARKLATKPSKPNPASPVVPLPFCVRHVIRNRLNAVECQGSFQGSGKVFSYEKNLRDGHLIRTVNIHTKDRPTGSERTSERKQNLRSGKKITKKREKRSQRRTRLQKKVSSTALA